MWVMCPPPPRSNALIHFGLWAKSSLKGKYSQVLQWKRGKNGSSIKRNRVSYWLLVCSPQETCFFLTWRVFCHGGMLSQPNPVLSWASLLIGMNSGQAFAIPFHLWSDGWTLLGKETPHQYCTWSLLQQLKYGKCIIDASCNSSMVANR